MAAAAFNFPLRERCLQQLVTEKDAAVAAAAAAAVVVPVVLVPEDGVEAALESSGASVWALACDWKGKNGQVLLLPSAGGGHLLDKVLLGVASGEEVWAAAALTKLPPGVYRLPPDLPTATADRFALGFALGCYSFKRYKADNTPPASRPRLVWPPLSDKARVSVLTSAFTLARDLITTPAEDLGPLDIAAEAAALAAAHGARCVVLQGEELLQHNYPAIHIVGRASSRPPALVDVTWAPPGAADGGASLPLLCLVGKGVVFDSGGLDLKPPASMKLMKKDMGGAALMMAVAHCVMAAGLQVRLRLMVPTVENAVSGNAYRPLDVLKTRAGISVENGNTDAEGRLILCDALFECASLTPDLLIDAATLTGAARAALGPEVPAVFSNDDGVWAELESASRAEGDPVWRLPLFPGYRRLLDSKVADLNSTGSEAGAGAITAALYLQEFVKGAPRWMHIDTGAYNSASRDGRPEGGEAHALRALVAMLCARYAKA